MKLIYILLLFLLTTSLASGTVTLDDTSYTCPQTIEITYTDGTGHVLFVFSVDEDEISAIKIPENGVLIEDSDTIIIPSSNLNGEYYIKMFESPTNWTTLATSSNFVVTPCDTGGLGGGSAPSKAGGLDIGSSELLPEGEAPNDSNFPLAAIIFGTAIAFLMGGLTVLEELKGTNTSSNMASFAVMALAGLFGLLGIIGWSSVFTMVMITGINLMTGGD